MPRWDDPRVKLLIVGSPFFGRTQTSPFLKKLELVAKPLEDRVRLYRIYPERVPAGLLPSGGPGVHAHPGAGGGGDLWPSRPWPAAGRFWPPAAAACPEYLEGSQAVLVDLNRDVPGQLAWAIEMLRDHPELRAEMGRAGAQAARRFSIKAFYDTFVDILADMGERI